MNSVRFNSMANSLSWNLTNNSKELQEAVARMSSGKRVTDARDDASGLAISIRLGAKALGVSRSSIEIESVHSMLKIMDSNMDKVGEMLNRMYELSVQAANDTNSSGDRQNLQKELELLKLEINHIQNNATYNGVNLFSPTPGTISVHASDQYNDTLFVSQQDISTAGLGIDLINLNTQSDSEASVSALLQAIAKVGGYRAGAGGEMNRLMMINENLKASNIQTQSSIQRIIDADMGAEISGMVVKDIRLKSTISLLKKVNEGRGNIVKLLQN